MCRDCRWWNETKASKDGWTGWCDLLEVRVGTEEYCGDFELKAKVEG